MNDLHCLPLWVPLRHPLLITDAADVRIFHRPSQITESGGGLTRTTTLEYDHSPNSPYDWPYIVGRPKRTEVTVAGETAVTSWTNNMSTGFRTSETIDGITTTFAPDAYHNVASVTKANGKTTFYSYSWGQVSQIQTPEYTITRLINPDGTIASETQADRTTSYLYDDLGRIRQIQGPGGTAPTSINYDTVSGRTVTTTRGPSVVTTTLDGFGRPVRTIDSLGVETRTTYDALGRPVYESYPFVAGAGHGNIGTQVWFDGLNRVTKERNPDGTERLFTYGANTVTGTDEQGRTTVVTYQAFGHPDDGRIAQLKDADNEIWTYSVTERSNAATEERLKSGHAVGGVSIL